ncbi:Low density lipoprotein receptor adapter protein 1-B-like protein [Dinothrombium tinctorium]|uniref:Low density lipoprotein receptor adapter protein 1-B-like protein n=1 Tax=Dinothrombium tinctorium TaxID=1965070 RepID=A0A3S3RLE5_9ACAR|nr:Low density lipoprotein receptor adapter protein 1-B-like protein [Dinothrombium tinctorium]RWS02736.1 Low density lipoprotein receptor adapter protein 1-B-like protein [Dinothrombium tinctorium]RWS02744.1 Low density lipoprotein receptor adapter protein 1-B-like protein [Dinothrombium tinctorium]
MSFFKAFAFGKSKHKKLPEDWGDAIKEPVNEGITFYVKYLGSTLVDEPSSDTVTAEAIKTIIAMAKASGKKLNHVALTVKPTGISTQDAQSKEKHLDISIYRISYCSADATYDRVVAFIATNKNETFECHAFLTNKRKMAQAAALTISQAFTIAFEKWKQRKGDDGSPKSENSEKKDIKAVNNESQSNLKREEALIDLSCDDETSDRNGNSSDFDFSDSFLNSLAESRAQNRTTPLLPSNLSFNNIEDLNQFISSNNHRKDENFFAQDSAKDLLLL